MKTYSCTPKKQNGRAEAVLAILGVALAAVCLTIGLGLGRRLLNEIIFLVLATVTVFVLVKFFFTSYTYTVAPIDGVPTLIIMRHQGSRETTLYHQELELLREIREQDGAQATPRKQGVDVWYRFFISISPTRWQELYFVLSDGQCVSVSIEADEPFLASLRSTLDEVSAQKQEQSASDVGEEPASE